MALAWSSVAGAILIAGLWQGLLLTALTGLVLRSAPRASASLRFLLWAATLVCATLLPFAEAVARRHHAARPFASAHTSLWSANLPWAAALAGLWLLCSTFRAAGLCSEASRLHRLRHAALPVHCSPELRLLLASVPRPVSLRHSSLVERPGVLGLWSPCILLPTGVVERLDDTELQQVILHELEHLRRRDDWFNLCQKLSLVLLPLSPALLYIDRRLCFERELACDEGVVTRLGAPRSYASLLAKLAEYGLDQRAASLVLGAMERPSQLARRVYRILEARRPASIVEDRLLSSALALALAVGTLALTRCPELVGFAPPEPRATLSSAALAAATPHVVYREASAPQSFVKASLPFHSPTTFKRKPGAHHISSAHPHLRAQLQTALPILALSQQVSLEPTTDRPLPLLVGYRLVRVEGGWLLLQL